MKNQKRINEIVNKIQERKEKQAAFRKEKLELTQEIGHKKQEIIQAFSNGISGQDFFKFKMVIEDDIRQLEEKVHAVEVKEARWELETRNDLKEELEELKRVRAEMVRESNEKVAKLEEELFKKKLEQVKELNEIFRMRDEMVEEIDDITSIIREIDQQDRKPTIKDFDTTSKPHISGRVSVVVTDEEIQGLKYGRLLDVFKLFIKHGIAERSVNAASSKLRELDKKN